MGLAMWPALLHSTLALTYRAYALARALQGIGLGILLCAGNFSGLIPIFR